MLPNKIADRINVIITGATGVAGLGVLAACMKDSRIESIATLTRNPLPLADQRLNQIQHNDFLDYSSVEDRLRNMDACFWCLGVSQAKVRKEADYSRITHDFTLEAARVLERLNPGMTFCFLSGMGTDSSEKSRMMWARIKGRTENDLKNFNLKLFNFRPGFIYPVEGRSGPLLGKILYPFIRNSKKMFVRAEELGRAMINVTLKGCDRHTLENPDIRRMAES